MKIFVDTSAFYALADEDDQYHHQAKAFYNSIVAKDQLVTTDYILVECWFLIGSRLGRRAAIEFWDGLRSGIAEVLKVEPQDLEKAYQVIQRYSDQDFSLVDATSFAVMEREKIEKAFAFDPDFQIYRFGERNERYFRVVPGG